MKKVRRYFVTGQVGTGKGPVLNALADLASRGKPSVARVHSIGELMYQGNPTVRPGRILYQPDRVLAAQRHAVQERLLRTMDPTESHIISTHAAFSWNVGLIPDSMIDLAFLREFKPDALVTVVAHVHEAFEDLQRTHHERFTLDQIMTSRGIEIAFTAWAARELGVPHFVVPRGKSDPSSLAQMAEMYYRLFFEDRLRIYSGYPITQVIRDQEIGQEIREFIAAMRREHVVFDPLDIEEYAMWLDARAAHAEQRKTIFVSANGRTIELPVADILGISREIDGQINSRDYKLIDQSDLVVAYYPKLKDGSVALSSGVERELRTAEINTVPAVLIWRAKDRTQSPFQTVTSTAILNSIDQLPALIAQLQARGMLRKPPSPTDTLF